MLCRDLVHVAGGVEVALRVVEGAERFFAFGVCAVPEFGAVEGVRVDVAQQGFEAAHVLAGCEVAAADCAVPFVVYEASRVAAEGEGDGHVVEVADVFGEVVSLFVGERVPRVGERLHDGEGGEEVGGFGDLVDGDGVGVHGVASFLLGFSSYVFIVAHVWACVLVLWWVFCARKCVSRHAGGRGTARAPVRFGVESPVSCASVVGAFFFAILGGYWRVVGEGTVSPPLFCLPHVSGLFFRCGRWHGVWFSFFFCVKGVVCCGY